MLATHFDTFERFIDGRLGADEWTHEAHLVTCWVALRDRTPAEALPFLRASIRAHNCGIGTANTDTGGYHETLTAYYVTAVAEADADAPEGLFEIASCSRSAPLNHWTREVLFSVDARRGWVAPDVVDLPWPIEPTLGG